LRELGFDAFAIDLIDAPEPILVVLCESAGLHMIVRLDIIIINIIRQIA
jgi:hypothetical protein